MGVKQVPWDRRCEQEFPNGRVCNREFIKYDGNSKRSCGGDHQEPWSSMKTAHRRNMPCECGSGKKTKRCCGAPEGSPHE